MRAIEIPASFDLRNLRVAERPEPGSPGPGQVLIRMSAVSLNYRDVMVATGHDRWRPPVGRIPVSDGVGVIQAVGSGVQRVAAGQRVMTTILPRWINGPLTEHNVKGGLGGPAADGVLADLVMLDAESVVPAPAYLSDEEAATLPCAPLTAWHAVTRAGSLRPGASILVEGTGGVSLFALQLGVAAGATVFVTSSADEKLERVRALGAAGGVNYRTHPDWDVEILGMTGGRGVDHAIDIGGASTLTKSIASVAFDGAVSIVGCVGGLKVEINVAEVFQKNLRLDGVETGSRAMLEAMLAWIEHRRIRPIIERTFALDDASAAFIHHQSGGGLGKICIRF